MAPLQSAPSHKEGVDVGSESLSARVDNVSGMDAEHQDEPELDDMIELISDGENLLVLGDDRRGVEGFLRSRGLLESAREVSRHQLVPALRSSADLVKTLSDAAAESSLWLKITPESAEAIKKYGLTDSGTPGIAYAMAGRRGDIKEWIKVNSATHSRVTNPGALSGAAGLLSQTAHEQEAAQLGELLESLDQKLDQVIRGQKDDILGDLAGIERQIRITRNRLDQEGELDSLTWSGLFGTALGLRQVQGKALLKLQGIAEDLGSLKRFGDLRSRLDDARGEVQQWLSVVARCVKALDELTVLELDYCAVLAPERLDERRLTLDRERQDDRIFLDQEIAVLLQRMDAAAKVANQNKIFHAQGVPKAFESIESVRVAVKQVYDAVGLDVDWDTVDPVQWLEAIRQAQQWKNGLKETSSVAWEKGKPVLISVSTTAVALALKTLAQGRRPSA